MKLEGYSGGGGEGWQGNSGRRSSSKHIIQSRNSPTINKKIQKGRFQTIGRLYIKASREECYCSIIETEEKKSQCGWGKQVK